MVEVLAVILVIAVFGAVIASRGLGHSALSTEADKLKANLRYAQTQAMSDSGATWSVLLEETQYTLMRNGAAAPFSWPGEDSATHVLHSAVTVSSGTGTLAYDAWGNPGTGDWSIVLQQDDETNTVTVLGTTGFVQ
jgi:type II secretory pathway pseudopilin PulG